MITTPQDMKAMTNDLTVSTWTLAAIGALYESGLAEELREPRSIDDLATRRTGWSRGRIERVLAIATESGAVVVEDGKFRLAPGAAPFAQPPMRATMIGDVRANLMQALAFLDTASANEQRGGWHHTSRALLEAQGDSSAMLAGIFKMHLVPCLDGLAARLESQGARFLDVGVGVASLAMGMCRAFPAMSVVGVDTYDVPLAIARDRIALANLGDRIELRRAPIEDLADERAFDLAWVPGFFIAEDVLPRALARVRASMRDGGWMVFGTCEAPAATPRQQAMFSLVNDLWGGPVLTVADAESLVKTAGFRDVRALPGPSWAPAMLTGRA
jgi:hypothetical protein